MSGLANDKSSVRPTSPKLTKNAHWIVAWLEVQSDTPLALPQEIVMNCGRWPYGTDTRKALFEAIDLQTDKLLAFKTYMVDVALFPYARQHKEVTAIATKWFNDHGASPNLTPRKEL